MNRWLDSFGMAQTCFPLQAADEDHMWIGFPLSILWSRHGSGIYLDSAEGSVTLSKSPEPTSASKNSLCLHQQRCGLENNNKALVDRIKTVTAEVKGFKLYLSWLNHKLQPVSFFTPSGSCFSRFRGSLLSNTQVFDLRFPKKAQTKQTGERSEVATYTLGGGDVHVAADEGQAIVHAHLEINHPGIKQEVQKWEANPLTSGGQSLSHACLERITRTHNSAHDSTHNSTQLCFKKYRLQDFWANKCLHGPWPWPFGLGLNNSGKFTWAQAVSLESGLFIKHMVQSRTLSTAPTSSSSHMGTADGKQTVWLVKPMHKQNWRWGWSSRSRTRDMKMAFVADSSRIQINRIVQMFTSGLKDEVYFYARIEWLYWWWNQIKMWRRANQ